MTSIARAALARPLCIVPNVPGGEGARAVLRAPSLTPLFPPSEPAKQAFRAQVAVPLITEACELIQQTCLPVP